jgi:hypothetical protein
MLAYNNNAKFQAIYIRQGDEADYLFPERANAVKWSPYNLKDPANGNGGAAVGNHNTVSVGGGAFVDYPSQAGYFFQWAGDNPRKAFHPLNPTTDVGITSWPGAVSGYWSTLSGSHETCPSTYRRPYDGIINGNSDGSSTSEIRQSLWLNPQSGGTSSVTNSNWGYYADGFFDRRTIQNSAVSATNSTNNKYVAYIGRLFFHPTTFASMFFPAAGTRNATTNPYGKLVSPGTYAQYATASKSSASTIYDFILFSTSAYMYTDGNHNAIQGYSIRCVKP